MTICGSAHMIYDRIANVYFGKEDPAMPKKSAARIASPGSAFNFLDAKQANLFGCKLQQLRKSRGLTMADICALLEKRGIVIGRNTYCRWELGQNVPGAYQFAALCDAFEMDDPVQYFTGRSRLNEEGLARVSQYKEDLIASGNYSPLPEPGTEEDYPLIEMPVSLLSVSAGTGNFLDSDNEEWVSFPESSVPRGADFGIRVSGDSMEPVYHDGQIVWVHRCEVLRPGEVGVFLYDGCGYLKLYSEKPPEDLEDEPDSEGFARMQPVLISFNKAYAPIRIGQESDFCVVGKVL